MTDKLMTAFDFTSEDLEYNRRGQLSPRQTKQLLDRTRKQKLVFLVASVVGLGIGVYLILPFVLEMSLQAANLGQLIGAAVALGLSALFFFGLWDKPGGDVIPVEGRVQFISRESSTTREDGGMDTHTNFYIVVGENEIGVKSSQYDAFTQGHMYRVYRSGISEFESSEILSIEYLGPPQE
jgi:hypothetical protein